MHRLRHGACTRRPHRRPGPPAAAQGTDNAAGAPGQAIRARKDREGGDPRGPGTTTVASACPSPTPDDSSTRAPVASAGAVGSSYAGAAHSGKPLQARGPFWRDDPRRDRDALRHYRAASPDRQAAIIDWNPARLTEQPPTPAQALKAWDQDGRRPAARLPTRKTRTNARPHPAGWGTTPTPEEGLWTRKGWAGRTH